MAAFSVLVGSSLLAAIAQAAPAPEPTAAPAPAQITKFAQINSSMSALSKGPASAFQAGYTSLLSAIQPSATPTDVAGFASAVEAAASAFPSNPFAYGAALILSGATGEAGFGNYTADIADFGPCNNHNNVNTAQPDRVIYPKQSPNDAPYDVPEAQLRSALYFPPGYTNGKVRPVIFLPGTGNEACEDFMPNLGKLLARSSYADPVYLNIPDNSLDDIQTNSEYIAYAINYVSATTQNKNVSVITWSQGAIGAQWALKYWPSTRKYVSNQISVSPDYHGTVLAPLLCPPVIGCAPSILQQYYTSNFIAQLRKNGGDSAYVPTTTIHSIFDEIVEPQQNPFASGDIGNSNGAMVTNEQIQDTCPPGTPAGGPNFGHESSLYNPISYALAKNAITTDTSGSVAGSGAGSMCQLFEAPGLTLADLFATEAIIPLAGYNIITYPNKTTVEPPIKPYATY